MINENHIENVSGTTVHDNEGNKIGKAGQVYLDDATGRPAWLTVNTGLFGTSENFVPIEGADLAGDVITVAYPKDRVKDAPKVDAEQHLDAAEEQELYRHYGLQSHGADQMGTDGLSTAQTGTGQMGTDRMGTDPLRADQMGTDQMGTDDAMTQAPAGLHRDPERAQTSNPRLRKYVSTQGQTSAVQHDEVRPAGTPLDREERVDLDADTAVRHENR